MGSPTHVGDFVSRWLKQYDMDHLVLPFQRAHLNHFLGGSMNPVGSIATTVNPDTKAFKFGVQQYAKPEKSAVEVLTKDMVKAHLADQFTAVDIVADDETVSTFAFSTKDHVYLAVEDDDGGARVFRVTVDEIV